MRYARLTERIGTWRFMVIVSPFSVLIIQLIEFVLCRLLAVPRFTSNGKQIQEHRNCH